MIPREIFEKIAQIKLPAKFFQAGLVCIALLGFCSCSSPKTARPVLPSTASFNWGAGCGNYLLIKLRLEDSDDFWFCVDTGSPITVLTKSFEAKLGKPIGRQKIEFPWLDGGKSIALKYPWPKLYLGTTRLQPGRFVVVCDTLRSEAGGHQLGGILGMDCLQHYCIQLDFDRHTIRFLGSDDSDDGTWGEAFPLAYSYPKVPFGIRSKTPQYPFPFSLMWGNLSARISLFGNEQWCGIDTGDCADGSLDKSMFQRAIRIQKGLPQSGTITNGTVVIRRSLLTDYSLNGCFYTNAVVHSLEGSDENVLGLRLLARNLVTFDFPNRKMYLKQQRVGPLVLTTEEERNSFQRFIKREKENGGLPWLAKDDKGTLVAESGFAAGTFSFHPEGKQHTEEPIRYYQFRCASIEDDAWALQRAWRMDSADNVVEEYPIP